MVVPELPGAEEAPPPGLPEGQEGHPCPAGRPGCGPEDGAHPRDIDPEGRDTARRSETDPGADDQDEAQPGRSRGGDFAQEQPAGADRGAEEGRQLQEGACAPERAGYCHREPGGLHPLREGCRWQTLVGEAEAFLRLHQGHPRAGQGPPGRIPRPGGGEGRPAGVRGGPGEPEDAEVRRAQDHAGLPPREGRPRRLPRQL